MTASNFLLAKKRCIVRDANFEKIDQACHVWFLQQRSNGAPLSKTITEGEGPPVDSTLNC